MIVECIFVNNSFQPSTRIRVDLLRLFGAKIGRDTLIRNIHVKFPWNLEIGDRCWLGEGVWLHNQDKLTIGADSVISQQTFITTGSHDLKETMDLVTRPVRIGRGVWVTSRCIVLAGVEIGDNAVLTPGSVANRSLAGGGVYGGNPARFLRPRWDDDGGLLKSERSLTVTFRLAQPVMTIETDPKTIAKSEESGEPAPSLGNRFAHAC